MLVLRRRVGEIILVGGEVEIEIIEISRTRVKLGVRAPSHVPVIRKETLPVIRENQMASQLVGNRGHEGVGELLKLLKQSGSPTDSGLEIPVQDASTKSGNRRYETSERYSGYRSNRENPHPA